MAVLRADNALLREQLALRDHALDATPSFFLVTKRTGPEPIIAYCNKIVADQHGFRREELPGKNIDVLARWAGHDKTYAANLDAALRAGKTFHYENEVTRSDGSTFWLGVSIRPIFDDTGRVTHSESIGADITAKREELRKKQELQDKLVEEMKEFAHPDTNEQSSADLNHAIQTTLLVASNEYKYLAKVHTEFAQLPEIVCNVGELNQVFLNLIVNAAHAIQDAGRDQSTGRTGT